MAELNEYAELTEAIVSDFLATRPSRPSRTGLAPPHRPVHSPVYPLVAWASAFVIVACSALNLLIMEQVKRFCAAFLSVGP